MSTLRRLDAFVKPREDLRTRSPVGGLITLVAASSAGILFLCQIYLYIAGATRHSLHLSESSSVPVPPLDRAHLQRRGKIPLYAHVTFPHMECGHLDIALDGASMRDGELDAVQGHHAIRKRMPTESELIAALGKDANKYPPEGCTIQGSLHIPHVGGTFTISVSKRVWMQYATFGFLKVIDQDKQSEFKMCNVSHHIHDITFGSPFPLSHNPLKDASYMVENSAGGLFLSHINVRLIPTRYQRLFTSRDTFQVSVTQHVVQPETLLPQGSPYVPGLSLQYDFSPLRVDYIETRDNIFGFISSLVSIVGGVFVTVGLVTGCLLHSAAAVAKKMD